MLFRHLQTTTTTVQVASVSCIVTSEAHQGQIIQNSVISSLQQKVSETEQAYSEYKDNVIGKLERLENQEIIAENNQ